MADIKKDENFKQQNQNVSQGQAQTQQLGGGASTGPVSAGSRTAQFSTGAPAKSGASSGRFTNLQSYIGANQGAGDRLYKGINSKLENEYSTGNKEAEKQTTAVRDGIAQAQQTLGRGQGYLEQTKKADFDAEKFIAGQQPQQAPQQAQPTQPAEVSIQPVQTPNTAPDQMINPATGQPVSILQDFSGFRTGSNVDANGLMSKNNAAITNAEAFYNQQNQRAQQAASETGRFDLLKQTYGVGPQAYTSGQQRLDNLFLQAGAGNNLAALRQTTADRVKNVNALGQQLDEMGNVIGTVRADQTALANDLQNQTNLLENNKVAAVNATEKAVNDARTAEQAAAQSGFQSLVNTGAIDAKLAQTLGLQDGERYLNVFNDNSDPNSYLKFNAGLTGADQLATAKDRTQYNALAQLAGLDPNAYRIKGDTKVAGAVEAQMNQTPGQQNETVLRSRINEKQAAFEQMVNALNGNMTENYSQLGPVDRMKYNAGTYDGSSSPVTTNINRSSTGNITGRNALNTLDNDAAARATLDAILKNGNIDGTNWGMTTGLNQALNGINTSSLGNARNAVTTTKNESFNNIYGSPTATGNNYNSNVDLGALLRAYRDLQGQGGFNKVKVNK